MLMQEQLSETAHLARNCFERACQDCSGKVGIHRTNATCVSTANGECDYEAVVEASFSALCFGRSKEPLRLLKTKKLSDLNHRLPKIPADK